MFVQRKTLEGFKLQIIYLTKIFKSMQTFVILLITISFAAAGLGFFLYLRARRELKTSSSYCREQEEKLRRMELETKIAGQKLFFLEENKKENEDKLKSFKATIKMEFENLSRKIFDQTSAQFQKDSKDQIQNLLEPVKEKIKEFQEQTARYYGEEAKERHSLKNEMNKMTAAAQKICSEADGLAQALKGDSQTQGAWGEMILNRVLEASGLRENEEYVVQGRAMGLKSKAGEPQKPDVIIKLPRQKHIVIDSKVSLTHYLKWHSCENKKERSEFLKLFVLSIKKHISNLSSKNYEYAMGLNSLDFVFLFFPIESALSTALKQDPHILDTALKKSIIIVSPSNLLAALRTVAFLWQRERESKNVLEIAKKAGQVYDKFVGFSDDLKQVGHYLERSTSSYHQAYKKLKQGRGNIIERLEGIKRLGARAEKNIDPQLVRSALSEEPPRQDLDL